MELRTFWWCVINYTKPGDIILDPMSGVGTIHSANFLGRNTVSCEIVPEFAELQRLNRNHMVDIWKSGEFLANWPDELEEKPIPNTSFPGDWKLYEGDCRQYLPLENPIDAVIFSPPYGNLWSMSKADKDSKIAKEKNYVVGYNDDIANIGNLDNYVHYLQAMKIVYRKCYESLKPGGLLVTVVKDYIAGGRRVYCSRDNLKLCLEVGFQMHAWHLRDASLVQSPFSAGNKAKRIAAGKHTLELEINAEDIMVVRK
jgi:DNA modification methylase